VSLNFHNILIDLFDRQSLAVLLKTPEKADWKACTMSPEEESQVVQQITRELNAFAAEKQKQLC
jgi:hypothetical protein